jgi:hypothetical protein
LWALPVLSVPAPATEVSKWLGVRHMTVPHRAHQIMLVIRRWLDTVQMTIIDLGSACAYWGMRLIAPLLMDAAPCAPAPYTCAAPTGVPVSKASACRS